LHRNILIKALKWLQKAELINMLVKTNKSVSYLSKPDKIWLHNTTLGYVLSSNNIDTGSIRETFFLQHISVLHNVSLALKADFLVDEKYIFEVGGKNKKQKQIQNLDNAFVVKDDIETGVLDIIPLWLFGLIY